MGRNNQINQTNKQLIHIRMSTHGRSEINCINLLIWHGINIDFTSFFLLVNVFKTISYYGICSKISNISCLYSRPRQTVQSQIRLLLKKQSNQGLHCYSDKYFMNSSLDNCVYLWTEREKRSKVSNIYHNSHIFRKDFHQFILPYLKHTTKLSSCWFPDMQILRGSPL